MKTTNDPQCTARGLASPRPPRLLRTSLAGVIWGTIIALGAGVISNVHADSAPTQHSHQSNAEIAESLFEEVWNKRNRGAIERFFAEECVFKMGGSTKKENGPKWYQDAYDLLHPAFPDIHFTTEEPVSQGDRVAIYWRGDGTNTGPYMGRPASNKKFHIEGIIILRFRDGKIVEFQEQWDALRLLQQIGIVNSDLNIF